ncbi:MAG: AAA family ATPase [Chloroflexia bacterium]
MRKIAVVNFKGGTGKTTTVVNLGDGLARRGRRVLLVDVDAQGGLALSLGPTPEKTLSDVLTGQVSIQEAIVPTRPHLDLLPSDNSLLQAQRTVANYVNWVDILAATLRPVEERYDFILLDCAASLTLLNVSALAYATEILIPTQVEYLSLMGLNQVLENLARVRYPNRPRQEVRDLGISLILPTMYDVRKRQSRQLLAELRQAYGRHVAYPIRTNVRLSEAPARRQTIFEYAPDSPGAFDYNRLVDLVLQETLLAGEEPIGLGRTFQVGQRGEGKEAGLETVPESVEEVPIVSPVIAPIPSEEASRPSPAAAPLCPYCGSALMTLTVAGYRVYQCERCGYQKQVLLRDLRT